LADTLWPVFVATGIEQVRIEPGDTPFTPLNFISYPYSHSLLFLIGWGLLFGFVYRSRTLAAMRVVWIMAALVVSHWALDVASHRRDMPLYPGSAKFGLGLWYSIPATVIVEVLMFVVSVRIYARSTRARDGIGRWGLVGLVAFLLIAYVANIFGG